MSTNIPYVDATWSPVTGCTPISRGCDRCWARALAKRWPQTHAGPGVPFDHVTLHPDRLGEPLGAHRSQIIFAVPRGDPFHPDVPDSFRDQMLAVVALRPDHTFLFFTKRPEEALRYLEEMVNGMSREALVVQAMQQPDFLPHGRSFRRFPVAWPPPNMWLVTSVEDQSTADERVSILLRVPVAHRGISIEPTLGPVDLTYMRIGDHRADALSGWRGRESQGNAEEWTGTKVDLVIVGGESGHGHRPMEIDWMRDLAEQCKAADVPLYVKQDSGRFPGRQGQIPDDLWSLKQLPFDTGRGSR